LQDTQTVIIYDYFDYFLIFKMGDERKLRRTGKVDYSALNKGEWNLQSPAGHALRLEFRKEDEAPTSPSMNREPLAFDRDQGDVPPPPMEEPTIREEDTVELDEPEGAIGGESFSEEEIAKELENLELEKALLNKQKRRESQMAKLDALRDEVLQLRRTCQVKGKDKPVNSRKVKSNSVKKDSDLGKKDSDLGKPKPSKGSDLDINALRSLGELNRIAEDRLKKFGLTHDDSDEGSSSGGSVMSTPCSSVSQSKRKGRKLKSGIDAKSSDAVRAPQVFPQSVLQYEYVNSDIKFRDLDFRLFVAGELEIIDSALIGEVERHMAGQNC
jgi:hypothetical protein